MRSYISILRETIDRLRDIFEGLVTDATEFTTGDHYEEFGRIAAERRAVTEILRSDKLHALQSADVRYNIEYMTANELTELTEMPNPCRFEGTHYWHWTPLLDEDLLRDILGKPLPIEKTHSGPWILELGAGNGTLLKKLKEMGYNGACMVGVDISKVGVDRIKEAGFVGFTDLKPLHLGSNPDVVFLSYFVDRDSDQRGTFERVVGILRPRGTLVLEGLFPCVMTDSNGNTYGNANVTKGNDTIEDIELVVAELGRLDMHLKRVIVGERLVYSLDGAEILPSYTLVFKKN